MTTVASNVLVGVTGGVYVAPLATALPVTPSVALNVAFKEVGYISEDGVTQSIGDSTVEIKAWQNADVVRRIQTDHSLNIKFMMIETNAVSLAAYYGNYSGGIVQIKAGVMPQQSWVLNVVDGTNLVRLVLPSAQVTDRSDIVYKNGDKIGYEITLECYPDSSSVKGYLYLATSSVSA